jgi:hypothetical protein
VKREDSGRKYSRVLKNAKISSSEARQASKKEQHKPPKKAKM